MNGDDVHWMAHIWSWYLFFSCGQFTTVRNSVNINNCYFCVRQMIMFQHKYGGSNDAKELTRYQYSGEVQIEMYGIDRPHNWASERPTDRMNGWISSYAILHTCLLCFGYGYKVPFHLIHSISSLFYHFDIDSEHCALVWVFDHFFIFVLRSSILLFYSSMCSD